jgi:hypothetical protein
LNYKLRFLQGDTSVFFDGDTDISVRLSNCLGHTFKEIFRRNSVFNEFRQKEKPEQPANAESSNTHSIKSEVTSATPIEVNRYIDFDIECSGIFSEKDIAMAKQICQDR